MVRSKGAADASSYMYMRGSDVAGPVRRLRSRCFSVGCVASIKLPIGIVTGLHIMAYYYVLVVCCSLTGHCLTAVTRDGDAARMNRYRRGSQVRAGGRSVALSRLWCATGYYACTIIDL